MLKFKQFILLEDRLDYLKSIHKNFDISHDSLAQHHEPNDIINHFAQNADPSQNKQHTQWILKQYKNKSIRQEDHPRINDALSLFQKHQSKLPRKDLNQYSDLNDLEDSVEPYKEIKSGKEQKKLDKSGAEKIHDENGFKVYHLKNKESACHYGKGTKWCTAADKNNAFDRYSHQGPLYYIEGKNNKGETKKFQFHFHTNQFMNDKDKEIDMDKFIKNNPEVKNVKEFQGLHPSIPLSSEGKQYHIDNLNMGDINSDDIKRAIDNKYLTPEHISNITKNPNSTDTHTRLVYNHRYQKLNLTPDHINNITKNPNSTDAHVALINGHINKELQLTPEHISNIIKNPNSTDAHKELIAGHNLNYLNLTPEHINMLTKMGHNFNKNNWN